MSLVESQENKGDDAEDVTGLSSNKGSDGPRRVRFMGGLLRGRIVEFRRAQKSLRILLLSIAAIYVQHYPSRAAKCLFFKALQ